MSTLHALASTYGLEWEELLELMANPEASDDEVRERMESIFAGLGKIDEKAERIALVADELARRAAALSDIAAEYRARANAARNRRRHLLEYAQLCLTSAGLRKAGTDRAGLRIQKNPPRAIINDPEALPRELCRITVEPDRAAILRELKAGKTIPGATLEQSEGVRVRLG